MSHIHPPGHFCGSNCPENPERKAELERNRRAAEESLRRLEVQERNEAALAKLPPVDEDWCDACGRYIEWDGHTEASHLRGALQTTLLALKAIADFSSDQNAREIAKEAIEKGTKDV